MITPKTINVPKGRRVHVSWAIIGEDGSTPSLIGKAAKLYYQTGRGRSEGTGVEINGNIITWDFLPENQFFLGMYLLELKLYNEDRELIVEFKYPDAFQLVKTLPDDIESESTQSDVCNINIKSYVDIVPGLQPADKCIVFNPFYIPTASGIIDAHCSFLDSDEQAWEEDFYHPLDYIPVDSGVREAESLLEELLRCDAAYNAEGNKFFKVELKEDDEPSLVIAHYIAAMCNVPISSIIAGRSMTFAVYESKVCNERFILGKANIGTEGGAIYYWFTTPRVNVLCVNPDFVANSDVSIASWAGSAWYNIGIIRALGSGLFDVAFDGTNAYEIEANTPGQSAVFAFADKATGGKTTYQIGYAYNGTNIFYKKVTYNYINDSIDSLAAIRYGAFAGATAYQKPSGGIPKSDLEIGVQTSLGKADTALQTHQDISGKANKSEMSVSESGDRTTITLRSGLAATVLKEHQSLAAYVNGGSYNSSSKKIELKHDNTVVVEIDATAFIKDGMVSNVAIVNGNLVISFNTDAGKEAITIPLTDIFNPTNYYNKTTIDSLLATVDKVFFATYGTTTAAEIATALTAGKIVVMVLNNAYYRLTLDFDDRYIFSALHGSATHRVAQVTKDTSTWSVYITILENTLNKVTKWQQNPDNNHYPAEKLVKDSIDALPFVKGEGENSAVQKGSNNTAFGENAVAEGKSTTSAEDNGIDTNSTDEEIETAWEEAGDNKFSLAKGEASHVEGTNNLALGKNSHAEGNGTIAGNNSAHSEGTGSKATGKYSHAEGLETTASGDRSHSEGKDSVASGKSAHAEGGGTTASGERAHAEGFDTVASGKQAHTEGWGTEATKSQSHAEGSNTTASGNASHAEGTHVVASGDSAHAEGVREQWTHIVTRTFTDSIKSAATESKLYQTLNFTTAEERYAVGMKLITLNGVDVSDQDITITDVYGGSSKWFKLSDKLGIGNKATASVEFEYEEEVTEWPNCGAKGEGSHVEGIGTNATHRGEHAEGRYNMSIDDPHSPGGTETSIHTIGIGTSNEDRKNAVAVMDNGDVYIKGIGDYLGTNIEDKLTLQAVINALVERKEVYIAYYDSTSVNDIEDALRIGAIVVCKYGDDHYSYYLLTYAHSDYYLFSAYIGSQAQITLRLDRNTGSWSHEVKIIEVTSNKLSTWQQNPDNNHYPAEKLVKDSIDALPFVKGDGQNSAIQKGNSNVALSRANAAIGSSNVTGLKGFYYKHIQTVNDTTINIFFSRTQVVPTMSSTATTKDTTIVPADYWAKDDIICIINDAKYFNCLKIVNFLSNGGGVQAKWVGDAQFNNINSVSQLTVDDYSVYCLAKPANGISDLGENAIAIGDANKAINRDSIALGYGNESYGPFAYTEGRENKAGYASHAEGVGTSATGTRSHSEGFDTSAAGNGSHAEGQHTTASGQAAHIEGHSQNKVTDVTLAKNNSGIISDWTTDKFSLAKGVASHVEGKDNLALGAESHAEGYNTTASESQTHAEGKETKASGEASHAEGFRTTASGNYSHTEGSETTASGHESHAEGWYTTAAGDDSHAEGFRTTASGTGSHAEGYNTEASGNQSHAEGNITHATAAGAHAEGNGTLAKGNYSHAEGTGTITNNNNEHAEGRYNISNKKTDGTSDENKAGSTLSSIGIGTSNNVRSNAVEVMQNGDVYVLGLGNYDGSNAGLPGVLTLQAIINSIVTNNQ